MTSSHSLRSTTPRRLQTWLTLAALLGSWMLAGAGAAWASSDSLQVYFIDVEGGQSTLFVTPAGKSLLIDTGWPGHDGRDANRIVTRGEARRRQQDRLPVDHSLPR